MAITDNARLELERDLGGRVRLDEPLRRHTSFRIGGPADVWVEVETHDDIRAVQSWSRRHSVPLWILGGGTNILVSDRGIRGVVLHLGRSLASLDWTPNGTGTYVRAGAALRFKRLVTEVIERDLSGLEFAEGIPGTVGGGLLMNAGAFGGEISNVVHAMEGVDAEGVSRLVERAHLRFAYRHFDLPQGFIVTHVHFHLLPGDPDAIRAKRDDAKRRREAHQPVGYPNAGSVFKNPPGAYAGRLLESAQMKGVQRGAAMVSPEHANFIVNLGGARAADVRALMEEAVRRVHAAHAVELQPEIKLVGDWSEPE